VLRTSLWFVPALEVVAAIVLFAGTLAVDRAAYHGDFTLPGWVISGSADAARQILTTIAAAIITVVGVVFSIILLTLTLASNQFGPRMLRNFIRDRGTQLTLGTFVATFVYAVLVLGSIGVGSHGEFVPHVGVTVTLGLMIADLAVLIYFIHHTAVSIQLPQVIASIAADLAEAIREKKAVTGAHEKAYSLGELMGQAEEGRRAAPASGTRAVHQAPEPGPAGHRGDAVTTWSTGPGTSSWAGTGSPRSGRRRRHRTSARRWAGRTSSARTGPSARTCRSASTSWWRSRCAPCPPPSTTPSPR
jgi:hypothetical protein